MNMTKAIYWIAVGAFGLALGSEYQNGNFQVLHRAADRAETAFCRIATHAEQSLAMVQVLSGHKRPAIPFDDQLLAEQQARVERMMAQHQADIERAVALHQADLDSVQEKLNRMQAALERTQFKRDRNLEHTRFKLTNAANRRVSVVCPRTGAKILIDADAGLSDMDTDPSDIEVGDSF